MALGALFFVSLGGDHCFAVLGCDFTNCCLLFMLTIGCVTGRHRACCVYKFLWWRLFATAWDECPCFVQEILKSRDNRHCDGIMLADNV